MEKLQVSIRGEKPFGILQLKPDRNIDNQIRNFCWDHAVNPNTHAIEIQEIKDMNDLNFLHDTLDKAISELDQMQEEYSFKAKQEIETFGSYQNRVRWFLNYNADDIENEVSIHLFSRDKEFSMQVRYESVKELAKYFRELESEMEDKNFAEILEAQKQRPGFGERDEDACNSAWEQGKRL